MNYPLISEYIEAIRSAEDNFATLTNLRPILNEDGQPIMTSGNFAVVFKMKNTANGNLYAVKCFLKDQPNRAESYKMIADELEHVSSTFLVQFRYLDKELFVDTNNSEEDEFPVLIMDWVEGFTLDKYIRQNIDDQYVLQMLAYQFSKLAMWIMPQPFAHGDIKPDNVMVREDGSLVLIDYDGMYVPAMKGQKARELGSPDFRHPSRTENDFDEHIDDFPLVSILLSLRLIAEESSLLEQYGAEDRLLFSEKDFRDIHSCELLKDIYPSNDDEINTLVSIFTLVLTQRSLSKTSYSLLSLEKPQALEVLSTEVTKDDLKNAWADEYGVLYSKDRKRLLRAPKYIATYKLLSNTKIICDNAFSHCESLHKIDISISVTHLGLQSFYGCTSLKEIIIPNNVTIIEQECFAFCDSLEKVALSDKLNGIEIGLFEGCKSLKEFYISKSATYIADIAFEGCASLKNIIIPNCLESIGDNAFSGCKSLQEITLPDSIVNIGESAFSGCNSIVNINIPKRVTNIWDYTFEGCKSLRKINVSNNVLSIGNEAFNGCESLSQISIPSHLKAIGSRAFAACKLLKTITLPNSVEYIGNGAFASCYSLVEIEIPTNITSIGKKTFECCISLKKITISEGVTDIDSWAFLGCDSLRQIVIPDSITAIGSSAFFGCKSIQEIIIPNGVAVIGNEAFRDCTSLQSITIPNNVESFGKAVFYECPSLHSIIISRSSYDRLMDNLLEYKTKIKFID